MIIVIAREHAKAGQRDRVAEAARSCIEKTRREDGCISYELFASTEDETSLAFVESWRDKEALRAHLASEHLKIFREAKATLVDEGGGVVIFEATPEKL
jgi:quinol monooxygenase YgiN